MFCKSLELDESVFAELISRQNHFSVLAHPVPPLLPLSSPLQYVCTSAHPVQGGLVEGNTQCWCCLNTNSWTKLLKKLHPTFTSYFLFFFELCFDINLIFFFAPNQKQLPAAAGCAETEPLELCFLWTKTEGWKMIKCLWSNERFADKSLSDWLIRNTDPVCSSYGWINGSFSSPQAPPK